MRVLITGAGGQLGRDVYRICLNRGWDVYAADSTALDITDYPAVRAYTHAIDCDLLINCAAYNAVDQAETDWEKAYRVNGLGVRNLALAVRECGGKLVHYSTDYIFDGESKRPYTIADPPRPINRYGQSKLLGEQCVRDLCERYLLIRVSWVFGKGNINFARKVIGWSRSRSELAIVDDQVSSPTYTIDLANATLDLIETGLFGLYHITNSGSCSRYAWASYILDSLGWEGTLTPACADDFPTQAKRPRFSVLDNFGTPETLGYSLPDWKDATRRFLEEMNLK